MTDLFDWAERNQALLEAEILIFPMARHTDVSAIAQKHFKCDDETADQAIKRDIAKLLRKRFDMGCPRRLRRRMRAEHIGKRGLGSGASGIPK